MARINILITSSCNLNCPYCFAKTVKEDNSITKFMPVEEFDKILNWCRNLNIKEISILGGEPTIHPNFDQIQEHLRQYVDSNSGRQILFTNGKHLENNQIFNFDNILLNVNECALKDAEISIEKVINCNRINNLFIGFNLYDGSVNYKFILDLLKNYSINRLRISVASPLTNDVYKTNSEGYFKLLKPVFVDLIQECYESNINLMFDCSQIPICYFDIEELELLTKLYPSFIDTRKHQRQNCNSVISILPDGICVPCFGHNMYDEINNKQIHYSSLTNLDEFYKQLSSDKVLEKCQNCQVHNTLCSGPCLSVN